MFIRKTMFYNNIFIIPKHILWNNPRRAKIKVICHHSNGHSCRIQFCAWLKLQTKRQVLDFQTNYFATIKITWAKAVFQSAVKFNTIKLEMIFVWINTWHTCVPNQWTFAIMWCITQLRISGHPPFFLRVPFSIRPADPISGNAFDGKRRKKRGWPQWQKRGLGNEQTCH